MTQRTDGREPVMAEMASKMRVLWVEARDASVEDQEYILNAIEELRARIKNSARERGEVVKEG